MNYPNYKYNWIRLAIMSYYTKCLDEDNQLPEPKVNIYEFTDFLKCCYIDYLEKRYNTSIEENF